MPPNPLSDDSTSANPVARQISVSLPWDLSSRDAQFTHTGKVSSRAMWASRRAGSGETFCRAGSLKGGFIRT
jgi:hypothetical protein